MRLEFALQFAASGVPIFPVEVRLEGDHWRKKPHIGDWAQRASTAVNVIENWWWRNWPDAHVGVPLERVNLLVIDADRHGGPDGVEALKAFDLPPHPVVTTRSGGEHHFFRQPALPAPRIRFWRWHGGEVLGDGRFVVAYALEPFVAAKPVLPRDLLERLPKAQGVQQAHHTPTQQHNHGPPGFGGDDWRVPAPVYQKMRRLISLELTPHDWRRIRGLLRVLVQKRSGRNQALNDIAFALREFIPRAMSNESAAELLFTASQLNGYVAKDGAAATWATIRSGLGLSPQVDHGVVSETERRAS